MYRILAEEGEVRESHNQKRHPHYAQPELLATWPNQVWSWDITKLKGSVKWTYFYLYVIMDIFSRLVVGWMIAPKESAELATHYRAEIDGLRAIAVVPVIMFHAGIKAFGGGFIGVDVFFVISGYLITSLILDDLDRGKFDFFVFVERRVRRILPALFFMLAVCIPLGWMWMIPLDLDDFGNSIILASTFMSNFLFWRQSGYFDIASEFKPLLHTWSLSVEGQFYLIFPFILMFAWRMGRLGQSLILTIVVISSFLLAQWGSQQEPMAAYYLLPTRAWELAVGCGISFYLKWNNHICVTWRSQLGSVLGMLMIFYAVFSYDKQTPFPGVYALLPVIGASLIVLCATEGTFIHSLLKSDLLVRIGVLSYSMYLWHYPLFVFARHRSLEKPSEMLVTLLIILTVVISYFSWRFIEVPFRGRSTIKRRVLYQGATAAILIFIAVSIHGNALANAEIQPSDKEYILSFRSYPIEELYKEGRCFLRQEQPYTAFDQDECIDEHGIVIWGDSYAAALAHGLRSISKLTQFTASGCPPIVGREMKSEIIGIRSNCKLINDHFVNMLVKLKPKMVILSASWVLYDSGYLTDGFSETIRMLHERLPGTRFVVLGGIPFWYPDAPTVIYNNKVNVSSVNGILRLPTKLNEIEVHDKIVRDVVNKIGSNDLLFVSLLSELCVSSRCIAVVKKDAVEPFSWDRGHLTRTGSLFVAELIKKHLGLQASMR